MVLPVGEREVRGRPEWAGTSLAIPELGSGRIVEEAFP